MEMGQETSGKSRGSGRRPTDIPGLDRRLHRLPGLEKEPGPQATKRGRGIRYGSHRDRTIVTKLGQANVKYDRFLQDAKDEPDLELISQQVRDKKKSVVARLQILGALEEDEARKLAARKRDQEDRARFQKFHELRQQAQLLAAVTGDQLYHGPPRQAQATAHEALAIYAKDPAASVEAWTLADPLPTALKDDEKARLRDGCYDLLLILTQEGDAAEGLRILDRAIQLRPQATAAYHLRRADCLGRSGDNLGRDRETRAAEQTGPETALDYLLNGRELAFRRRFDEAIISLNMALQRDPDQTSAHLLLAVCYHNKGPKLLSAARTSLDACIKVNRDMVGLYLLRASIYGEEGSQAQGTEAAAAFDAAEKDYAMP